MNRSTVLLRKRLIPDECVCLDGDVILHCDDAVMVTSWKALHPKFDLARGYSAYYLKEGFKLSRFIAHDGSLMYWYCDIVRYDYDAASNRLLVTDLLADVLLYPDGRLRVMDLDELALASEKGLLDAALLRECLRSLHRLLERIYRGEFGALTRPIMDLL